MDDLSTFVGLVDALLECVDTFVGLADALLVESLLQRRLAACQSDGFAAASLCISSSLVATSGRATGSC